AEVRIRQKLAFVVKESLSVGLSRIAEFSPVTITRFTSTVLIKDVSYLLLAAKSAHAHPRRLAVQRLEERSNFPIIARLRFHKLSVYPKSRRLTGNWRVARSY